MTFFFFFYYYFNRYSYICCFSFGLMLIWLTLLLSPKTSSGARTVSILVSHARSSLYNSLTTSFFVANYLSNFVYSSSSWSKCGFHCLSSAFLCYILSLICFYKVIKSWAEKVTADWLAFPLPFLTIRWYFLISR